MSAQPSNTTISVFMSLRAKRDDKRTDSVAAITKRLNPLLAVIPGREIDSGFLTRDTSVSDFSPWCGLSAAGASRGAPIVLGKFPTVSFSCAQEHLPDVDFAFKIGRDSYLPNTQAVLATADLFGDAIALQDDPTPPCTDP